MRPEVNSNQFQISNHFEMSFRLHGNLHGDFTAATFQTMVRLKLTEVKFALKSSLRVSCKRALTFLDRAKSVFCTSKFA